MAPPRYAELHARTSFSFLDGASSPEELVRTALQAGVSALAITDVNGLYGVVEAREALIDGSPLPRPQAEAQAPLKLLYGSELTFDDDTAVALVARPVGYRHLCQVLSEGRLSAPKGEFRLSSRALTERAEGLFLLAGGPRSAPMRLLQQGQPDEAARRLLALREAFGERLLVELVRHQGPGDLERSKAMAALARRLGLPVVASNDVRFHHPGRKPMHDLQRCIHHGVTLEEAGRRLLPNAEAHVKSAERMARLFHDLPEAVERAAWVADSVHFLLTDVRYDYPTPALPDGADADAHLKALCLTGLLRRLGAPKAQSLRGQLERELGLIRELRYAGYFLSMREVVEVCRHLGILCQGRGSAANSLVCYALGITSVHPDSIDMLFERFVSKERAEPPDIDLDIEHERREEVLQYVYRQHGRRHAAMVAEVIRYRHRSALRDVGKALGFTERQLERLSKFLSHSWADVDPRALQAAGVSEKSPQVRALFEWAQAFEGMPRHLSIHVGGFVLSKEPLDGIVPIENGRMADRTVIQWNKDDVDAMGMFKVDLLGLGMLTVLAKAFALLERHRGVRLGLEQVPPDDPPTYAMLQRADTVGVFQVESRAQMNMLPRLAPENFYDLVVEVALVRPGPIQGQMVHPYLRRKQGKEKVEYPHPKLESILKRTLGVPLFQEQVMRLAEAVGGYTAGQADQLRRDMGSWRATGKMERHRERLVAGMRANGLSEAYAERVFQQIQGFGAYGFPEAHAAAFAHLAYVSAYLKCNYPCEFACALLNAQPMGFYSPPVIVNDLKRHGVEVRRTDVQRSDWDCTVEDGALRLGLRLVRGLGEAAGKAVAEARAKGGPFRSVEEVAHRSGLPRRMLQPLAAAGAFASLHGRREALWNAAAAAQPKGPLLSGAEWNEPRVQLPALSAMESLALDVRHANAFPEGHPLALIRPRLLRQGVLKASELAKVAPRSLCRVAGLVITRQKPAARGFVFLTLEDETGHADISVSPGAFVRYQDVIRLSSALLVHGRLVTDGRARNLALVSATPLSLGAEAGVPSHDFH